MTELHALHRFLRGEFDTEEKSGFARLRRIPDTHVRHFLDYYTSLIPREQDALADASTLWGALTLMGNRASEHYGSIQTHSAWEKWRHEMAMGKARDPHFYHSVPFLRTCVAQAKIGRARGKPSQVSAELEQYASSIRSVKAPELRKRVRAVLEPLLGLRPRKHGGGIWDYEGTLRGSQVAANVNYGGWTAQLRYYVTVVSLTPVVTLERAAFEVALGAGLGDWDFIVEENVSDAIALLPELVLYVAELPARLPESCFDGPGA